MRFSITELSHLRCRADASLYIAKTLVSSAHGDFRLLPLLKESDKVKVREQNVKRI